MQALMSVAIHEDTHCSVHVNWCALGNGRRGALTCWVGDTLYNQISFCPRPHSACDSDKVRVPHTSGQAGWTC